MTNFSLPPSLSLFPSPPPCSLFSLPQCFLPPLLSLSHAFPLHLLVHFFTSLTSSLFPSSSSKTSLHFFSITSYFPLTSFLFPFICFYIIFSLYLLVWPSPSHLFPFLPQCHVYPTLLSLPFSLCPFIFLITFSSPQSSSWSSYSHKGSANINLKINHFHKIIFFTLPPPPPLPLLLLLPIITQASLSSPPAVPPPPPPPLTSSSQHCFSSQRGKIRWDMWNVSPSFLLLFLFLTRQPAAYMPACLPACLFTWQGDTHTHTHTQLSFTFDVVCVKIIFCFLCGKDCKKIYDLKYTTH